MFSVTQKMKVQEWMWNIYIMQGFLFHFRLADGEFSSDLL